MDIPQAQYGNVIVLSPAGRIDHSTSDEFRKLLEVPVDEATSNSRPVVFDLSGVEYISSAGLRCFMLASKQAKARGSQMVVAALQPVVREIFEISRFTLVFDTYPSVRDALAALAPEALPVFDGARRT
jgi:anti-sigma B factor antagonist